MIQFNLLPDVKLNYVKTQRLKHTIILISIILASISLGIMLILILIVDVAQKAANNSLNNYLNYSSTQLKNTPNLNHILTLQSELNNLKTLQTQSPVATRLPGFLSDITPNVVGISSVSVQFGASASGSANSSNSVSIEGATASLADVNQFVDILKLSSFKTSADATPVNAFTNVVLSNFGYSSEAGATFTVTANFNPALFADPTANVSLVLPSDIVTHSTAVESQDLFVAAPPSNTKQGN